MKTIFRTNNKTGNFTCISNFILQSETLSPDEIGVFVRLLSLPDNFVINKTSIWKTMNIGREHFNKVWNKLIDAGYIQTVKTIDIKSKHFEYAHSVHEIPIPRKLVNGSPVSHPAVNQIPVHQKPVDGKLVSLIIDNKKDPEQKIRININLSDPRTEGEGGQGQNKQDHKNIGPDSSVVQFPSSTDYGKLNEEQEQKIPTEVPKHNNHQGLICESDIPELELDDTDIKNFITALDDIYAEKFPKWVSMLKNKPLLTFLDSTKIIHKGDKELISMITVLQSNIKK